jgi:hypothetical protein
MGVYYDEETRWLAVEAVLQSEVIGDIATQLFAQKCQDANLLVPSNRADFLHRWITHFRQHRNVDDSPGRGRKSHVSADLLDIAEARFSAGYISKAQVLRHWTSFENAATWDRELVQVVAASGVTTRTFFRHLLMVSLSGPVLLTPPLCSPRLKHPPQHMLELPFLTAAHSGTPHSPQCRR